MRPRVKGALLLVLAFALGAGAGALGFGVYLSRTERWGPARPARLQEFVLRHLTRELKLTPDQRRRVEVALRESGEEFARLREEVRPRFREIRARSREHIKAILDAGQQARFDALADEWERRWERWRGPSGPPESKGPPNR